MVLAAVTFAAIFVYLNTLSGDFVWDDRKLIVDDPAITSWNHFAEIFSNDFFSRNEDDVPYGYYRPVTTTSYLLDYTMWGLRPFGYHLTNVLLHAACTAMVALILLRLGIGLSASAIAALLFAVHPIHTENVAWIAGRTDLLAFFFTGVALLLHPLGSTRDTQVRDAPLPRATTASRSRRWLLLAASVLAFTLALLAKEMSVVLIAWLVLIHLLVRRHTWRASAIAVSPYVCVLALYLVWRFLIIQVWLPGELPEHRLSSTLLSSGPTIVRYLIWMLVPVDLNAYVQNPYVTTALDLRCLGSVVIVVFLGLMLWRFAAAEVLLLAAMLAVSFLPILNLVRAAAPADMGNMMAERFCYFASFPFLALIGMAFAWALSHTVRIAPLRYILSASLIVVIALGALRTVERNRDWNNELRFLTKTLEQNPRAVLLWSNLAGYHLRRRDLDRATKAIEQAEALDPNSHAILSSRALWYVVSGRLSEAIPLQKRIVREAGRGQTAALNNLAYLYRMTGQQAQAQSILEALIRSGTNRADPHFNLGEIYHAQGQMDEARAEYRLALDDRPNDLRTAEALASLEVEAGRADAAETIYRRMLAVYPDEVRIWNNLALVRHGQGDTVGALEMLAHVVQIQPGYLKARINYAQLLHDSGRTSEAVTQLEKVVRAGAGTELATLATEQLAALQSHPGARTPRNGTGGADAREAAGTTHSALNSTGDWRPPSAVVLVTVDTLRADFVSFNGHDPATTPFLDTLAQKGVVFTQAYAPSSWTVPSMASLFTSLAPTSHGVTSAVVRRGQVRAQRQLPASLTTLAESLQQAGYVTVGVPANLHLASQLGFAQGFDYYGEAEFMPAPEVNLQAGMQLQRAFGREWETAWSERKTFLWIHYFDPHDPYAAHEPWISRYAPEFERHPSDFPAGLVMRDIRQRYPTPDGALAARIKPLYESEVSYVDEYLRRLSQQLALDDDNVLLIVTSDHGEEIADHQSLGHGHTLYQELVHIPLLMHWPNGLPQGMRIDSPVSLLDIYPTLIELLGLETPPGLQGESLAGLLRKQTRNEPRKLYFELDNRRAHPVTLKAVRDREWKLIREREPAHRTMLFNLAGDPTEQHDVSAQYSEVVSQLDTALDAWLGALPQPPSDLKSVPIDATTRERLRALGYLQ